MWPPAGHYYYHVILQMKKLRHRESVHGDTAGKGWSCNRWALLMHMDHSPLRPWFQVYLLQPLVATDKAGDLLHIPLHWVLKVLISHLSSVSHHTAQYGLVPVTYLPCSSSSHCLSSLASRPKVICPSLCPLGIHCVSIANQHCLKLLVNSYNFPEPHPYCTYLPQEGIHWVGSSIHSFM